MLRANLDWSYIFWHLFCWWHSTVLTCIGHCHSLNCFIQITLTRIALTVTLELYSLSPPKFSCILLFIWILILQLPFHFFFFNLSQGVLSSQNYLSPVLTSVRKKWSTQTFWKNYFWRTFWSRLKLLLVVRSI
jgi:hypothetical protein